MNASLIICTYNHAESLRQTLDSLRSLCVPEGLSCELLVVDNASTDDTADVVRAFTLPAMPVRYIQEPRIGQCFARNAGVAAATGEVILFTDDDVRPCRNWIVEMSAPIVSGKAEAVVGSIRMAPDLEREWMRDLHRASLAETQRLDQEKPGELVGANMAFSRQVLSKVPCFDTELGPGALGFCDDTLFSLQIIEAGFRIASAQNAVVEHHFDASRLRRTQWLNALEKSARSWAYVAHHWKHDDAPRWLPRLKRPLRLRYTRWRHRKEWQELEGMPEWEMRILWDIHFNNYFAKERKKPRKYSKHGLVKAANA